MYSKGPAKDLESTGERAHVTKDDVTAVFLSVLSGFSFVDSLE